MDLRESASALWKTSWHAGSSPRSARCSPHPATRGRVLRLHSQGLCYRDISFANVFFDPTIGDVRICDNDNVDVSGTESGGVLGTPRLHGPSGPP